MDPAAERLQPLLGQLVNYERTRPNAQVWSLEPMRALLALPAMRVPRCPAVQVGGSKGKGTTCAFVEGLARAAGLRVGLYTSPHVDTLLERIRIDGRQVEVGALEGALREVLALGEQLGAQWTFFEAMTAAAALLFADAKLDLAIWEVGLGGRLDATTALPVQASVLTSIELEHTELLGSTVEAIAGEKAPIIRPGGVGLSAVTGPAAAVVAAHCARAGARLLQTGRDFDFVDGGWSGVEFRSTLRLPSGRRLPVRLPDARAYELPALALAASTLDQLQPELPLALAPSPRPQLPCRFEVLRCADGRPLILDGAHTEQSIAAVAVEMLRRWPGERIAVLFGSAVGKRWQAALSPLLAWSDNWRSTVLSGTVGEDPAVIAAWLRQHGKECEPVVSIAEAWDWLNRFPGPRLVVGSFYLAGQIRRLFHA